MPNQMKIQPLDFADPEPEQVVSRPVFRSRVRRLFDRQRRTPPAHPFKPELTSETDKHGSESDQEFDPSTLCLANMVQNYLEEGSNEKQRCGKNRCNCFNRTPSGTSDEWESFGSSSSLAESACDVLKSLASCADSSERNILADVSKILAERNRRKDATWNETVVNGLIANGYNASTCKSKWDKSPFLAAGDYEYVDVVTEGGERFIIDIHFKSEFDIARPTKAYKAILQTLPSIFVGKADRLEKIIDVASEAVKKSLKKRGMPIPPWRKPEYVKAKWLSPQIKPNTNKPREIAEITIGKPKCSILKITSSDGEIEIVNDSRKETDFVIVEKHMGSAFDGEVDEGKSTNHGDVKSVTTMVKKWEPPAIIARPRAMHKGGKLVTGGLSTLIEGHKNP